ncbi:acyl-CoA dehydrogenase family protein [Trujillonella endophytica]|uniref:Acyl-CoA dehydrogenase n=1 Tax=Trujillonella endophytica TaxID=673521 RepID=A0A1H8VWM6_9ACTN|nr:acyl-CoA dehydrogenase family protein [Trujillella endophytica]SEP19745.1 Acyl-CoA dehydrogenase [Trujillella endophytica]
MDFSDSPEVAEFRADLRAWLAEHLAEHADGVSYDSAEGVEATHRWHRALAAAGYVAVSLDPRYGGRGLSDLYEAVINEELAAAAAPPPPPIGHIAHAVADFASDDLKGRVLPGLLGCTESWCQGFSEPGAGSDLAGLSTTAAATDGGFVVNGQKIWTSWAMWADRCLLLCRTEPDQPRHRGLSMLVVDMDTPGITRREITLANGSREFAEVFFDDVRVPAANLVGERGQGWKIAQHMLTYERGPADMGWTGRLGNVLAAAQEAVRSGRLPADDVLRRRLAAVAVDAQVLSWHVARSLVDRESADPGSSGSIDKLLTTRVEQELYHVVDDLLGAAVVVGDQRPFSEYLWSRAQSIYGGTQQIQRQIVAQRLLGLPRG